MENGWGVAAFLGDINKKTHKNDASDLHFRAPGSHSSHSDQ